jgi:hypothetical protein
MPTLDIGGTDVEVPDSFLKLPPERQKAEVEEIAAALKIKPGAKGDTLRKANRACGANGQAGHGVDRRSSKARLPRVWRKLFHRSLQKV